MTRSPHPRFVHEASKVMDAPWMWRGGEVGEVNARRCEGEVERVVATLHPIHAATALTPRGLPVGWSSAVVGDHSVSKVDSHLAVT